jgi:hypothetical protein
MFDHKDNLRCKLVRQLSRENPLQRLVSGLGQVEVEASQAQVQPFGQLHWVFFVFFFRLVLQQLWLALVS